MNNWKKDDRAVLAERPELVGTVKETPKGGVVEVALDGGGTGRFKAGDLIPEADAPMTTKTWPPSGLETKTAAT